MNASIRSFLGNNSQVTITRPSAIQDEFGQVNRDYAVVYEDVCSLIEHVTSEYVSHIKGDDIRNTYLLHLWRDENCIIPEICEGDRVEDQEGKVYKVLEVKAGSLMGRHHKLECIIKVWDDKRFTNFGASRFAFSTTRFAILLARTNVS